jgi:hypothetical protein
MPQYTATVTLRLEVSVQLQVKAPSEELAEQAVQKLLDKNKVCLAGDDLSQPTWTASALPASYQAQWEETDQTVEIDTIDEN